MHSGGYRITLSVIKDSPSGPLPAGKRKYLESFADRKGYTAVFFAVVDLLEASSFFKSLSNAEFTS